MPVESKVGNLPTKFGHARPLRSGIIRFVRDGGQTDKRMDRQTYRRTEKSTLIAPYSRGHNKHNKCCASIDETSMAPPIARISRRIFFHEEKTSGTPLVAAPLLSRSVSCDRRTNKQTNGRTDGQRHRVKLPSCDGLTL